MLLHSDLVPPALAVGITLIAAYTDIRSRRIPNWLTGSALVCGLGTHLLLQGARGLLNSFAAALIAGIIFLIFHLAGGMGAGDVKLIAATASLLGLPSTPYLLILTSLVGGVMAVALALSRGRLKSTLFNVGAIVAHHKEAGLRPHPEINVKNSKTLRLPYGIAIAAACLLTFLLLRSGSITQ